MSVDLLLFLCGLGFLAIVISLIAVTLSSGKPPRNNPNDEGQLKVKYITERNKFAMEVARLEKENKMLRSLLEQKERIIKEHKFDEIDLDCNII